MFFSTYSVFKPPESALCNTVLAGTAWKHRGANRLRSGITAWHRLRNLTCTPKSILQPSVTLHISNVIEFTYTLLLTGRAPPGRLLWCLNSGGTATALLRPALPRDVSIISVAVLSERCI